MDVHGSHGSTVIMRYTPVCLSSVPDIHTAQLLTISVCRLPCLTLATGGHRPTHTQTQPLIQVHHIRAYNVIHIQYFMYIIHKVYKIQLLPTCLRVIVPCYVFATYFLKPYLCPILSTARKSLVTSLAHSNAVCVVSRHPPTTTSPCEAMSG